MEKEKAMSKEKSKAKKTKLQVKEKLAKKLESLIIENLFIIKVAWFILVFISVLTFVVYYHKEIFSFTKLSEISTLDVLFLVLIILLLYPLFDTIKISPTGGIEFSNKEMNGKFNNITLDSILKVKLADMKNNLEAYINTKLNQRDSTPSSIRKDQPHSKHDGLRAGIVEEISTENFERSEGSNEISSLDDTSTLIDNIAEDLIDKYEKITDDQKDDFDKNDEMYKIYKILNDVIQKGIAKFDGDLSIDIFNEWKDNSKYLIEAVTNNTDINLYDNYCSLIDSLEETKLKPYQKLTSCLDYLMDIMKLVAEAT